MTIVMRRPVLAAVVAVTLMALCACASEKSGDQPSAEQAWGVEEVLELARVEAAAGHGAQAQRLEDGRVTFEEYQAAFNELSGCLRNAGITVSDPVISPVSNDRYEFTMDTGALDTNVGAQLSDECAAEHWTSVSQAYMFTTTPVMDAAVRDASIPCLEGHGLKPTGEETQAGDFASLPDADPTSVTECIMQAVEDTHPGLPAVTVTF